jgi:hypothetical protein
MIFICANHDHHENLRSNKHEVLYKLYFNGSRSAAFLIPQMLINHYFKNKLNKRLINLNNCLILRPQLKQWN